ncbi:hypothetical protein VTJ04DRAFT_2912 [Mycothermus thermophilus]|uniref:uncharacterized protein n=1 Tax=Humicola insolens TaxID=85995 RepID=UPI003743A178
MAPALCGHTHLAHPERNALRTCDMSRVASTALPEAVSCLAALQVASPPPTKYLTADWAQPNLLRTACFQWSTAVFCMLATPTYQRGGGLSRAGWMRRVVALSLASVLHLATNTAKKTVCLCDSKVMIRPG